MKEASKLRKMEISEGICWATFGIIERDWATLGDIGRH